MFNLNQKIMKNLSFEKMEGIEGGDLSAEACQWFWDQYWFEDAPESYLRIFSLNCYMHDNVW
jgi:hypothetical protein